jgi:pre-mRNA-processing factor SLU7
MKTTVRNLRIREDTPKYLRNLDLNSAFYDPKTRSMRMNPFPDENPEDLVYAGDNFVRHTGDAAKLAATELLCWEMQARGEDVDVISNPSQAELLKKQFTEKKKVVEEEKRRAIFEKYGVNMPSPSGDGSGVRTEKLDPRLILGQTEAYVEYSADGRIIKGAGSSSAVKARTKYEEDVLINNHTSVWGSYFNRSRMAWGFACCHSLIKNSYCTGAKGREANDNEGSRALGADQAQKMLESVSGPSGAAEGRRTSEVLKRSDVYGEFDSASKHKLNEAKVQEALQRMDSSGLNGASGNATDNKKRSYNSMQSIDVTPEDMEAYRLRKAKFEDPMAKLLSSDEILEYK